MYVYNLVRTRVWTKEATENALDVLNDPQSSWKYVENMYYMNIQ